MSSEPFYTPGLKPPPPRQPTPGEPLWTLRKDVGRIAAELRHHGRWGVELQVFRDGDFFAGRRFDSRELAIAAGGDYRRELEADGWVA